MKLLPAASMAALILAIPSLLAAGDPVDWRNDAPVWKPITPADRVPEKWTAVQPPAGTSSPNPAEGSPAAILDFPKRLEESRAQAPAEKRGAADPPFSEFAEPAPFPKSLRPSEPIVAGEGEGSPNRPVTWTEQVEQIDILPRVVERGVPEPSVSIVSSLDRVLPPDAAPPVYSEDDAPPSAEATPATLAKPRRFGHRVRNWFDKSLDLDLTGSRIFHGQLFDNLGIAKPTFYWRDELLLWRMNNDRVPVLGTTGTPASGGVIGQPGTQLLFGPGPIDLQDRIGERSRATLFFPEHNWGVDGSFMFLGPRSSSFTYGSNNFPVISRPVYVLNPPPGEFVETVAFPGFSAGTLSIQANTKFWASDVNVFKRVCDECRTLDIFVGYRYLYFSENLQIEENIIAQPGAPDPAGTYTVVADKFGTRNLFNGAQIGLQYGQDFDRWRLEIRSSVALGVNSQSVNVQGYQARSRPGEPLEVFTGGLLAAQSNIGHFSRRRFSVVPDVNLNVGYQLTDHMRAYVGYSFLYWSNVVRPGGQIDRVVDLNYIPNTPPAPPSGQRRPTVPFGESDLFLHGVTMGLEWLW